MKTVRGDLLQPAEAGVHGCNCRCRMGRPSARRFHAEAGT